MMNRKILEIIAIAVVFLFLLTPVSAMLSIDRVKEEPADSLTAERKLVQPIINVFSFIPQSEFVITFNESEEVIWIADSVTRDDDIAYVTVETNVEVGELDREPQILMKTWRHVHYKITARNWWGMPLFYTRANAWARFDMWTGECNYIIDLSTSFSFSLRYTNRNWISSSHTEGVGQYYVKVTADGYFKDVLIRRYPHIHVWAAWVNRDGYTTDGYLTWDDPP